MGEERDRKSEYGRGRADDEWTESGAASMKEEICAARSRSEDDETLIKVNEVPELPG